MQHVKADPPTAATAPTGIAAATGGFIRRQKRRSSAVSLAVVTILAGACAPFGTTPAPRPGEWFLIVEASTGRQLTIAALADRLTDADVVFFGEQHDDPGTHRAQRALLEEIARTSRPAVVSLEMFERDVQSHVDDYLSGAIPESEFLAQTRPWPRYATDYRPLIEAARRSGWPVVAANMPRPIAAAVGRQGLAAVDSLQQTERTNVALSLHCPDDAYRRRFLEQIRAHPVLRDSPGESSDTLASDTMATAVAERFYAAQCAKDETMAESIVHAAHAVSQNGVVVHLTGAFHSDYSQGTVERVRRRDPRLRIVVLTGRPVDDPATADIGDHRDRADIVIFTWRPPPG